MKRVYEIPVLGKILKYIVLMVKAPKHIQMLSAAIEEKNRQIEELQKTILFSETRTIGIEKRISRIEEGDSGFVKKIISGIPQCYEEMMELNRNLSSCPVIWGDKDRLHISPRASVHSCLFNTNSGHITIDDYTFAGSHVSILAGSHDVRLKGFLRRDADYQEGFDITIGKGVWLASGSTILGPCKIGDSAVIAAGAVVIPGTEVPPNAVYGGVPAKLIRMLDSDEETEQAAIMEGLERNNGFLLVDGWSQKLNGMYPFPVNKMLDPEATIITIQSKAVLYYYHADETPQKLTIRTGEKETEIALWRKRGAFLLEWEGKPGEVSTIVIRRETAELDLFVAVFPDWKDGVITDPDAAEGQA